ncbi:uncharacterized protein TNCV_148351 [Trichonephila clavipes]|nr:uncharacterized protein TNCV_148351 [Trichonephila clavipes]
MVKPEGYRFKIDRTTLGICRDKKSIIRPCFKNKYVLNNECEWDVCENKYDEIVPFYEFTHFPFAFYDSSGRCNKGKLTNVQRCPTHWDTFETDLNLTELPQVFNTKTKKCEIPKLCENVKLVDSNAVVPAWNYQKHLSTWNASILFDRTIGYKCDSNNMLEEVNVEYGYLIKDYKLVAACETHFEKIPTRNPNIFYDCKKKSIGMCSPGSYFNGKECIMSIPNFFKFKKLDVFKFNELKENNWIQHRLPSASPPPKCESDEISLSSMCVHKDCEALSFIRELKRPIKLTNEYQCVWDEPRIKKVRYDKPYGELNFWTQNFTTEKILSSCLPGDKVQTGNFILDSTLYVTCKWHQPFVFCPSTSTEGIIKVGSNLFACKPNDEVYSYKLPAQKTIKIILQELDYIFIPKSTWYNIDNQPFEQAQSDISLYKTNIVTTGDYFVFQADQETTINYKILANNPPNSYIKDQTLHRFNHNYSIITDNQTTQPLRFHDYTILSNLNNFNS